MNKEYKDVSEENNWNDSNSNSNSNSLEIICKHYGGFWPPQPIQGFLESCDATDSEILESIYYRVY
jgi:hypothetical protein